jgi:hypothetical protein
LGVLSSDRGFCFMNKLWMFLLLLFSSARLGAAEKWFDVEMVRPQIVSACAGQDFAAPEPPTSLQMRMFPECRGKFSGLCILLLDGREVRFPFCFFCSLAMSVEFFKRGFVRNLRKFVWPRLSRSPLNILEHSMWYIYSGKRFPLRNDCCLGDIPVGLRSCVGVFVSAPSDEGTDTHPAAGEYDYRGEGSYNFVDGLIVGGILHHHYSNHTGSGDDDDCDCC